MTEIVPDKQGELRRRERIGWREAMKTWLDATTTSKTTREAYRRTVEQMFQFLGVETPAVMTAQMLAEWRADMVAKMESGALAPATVARHISAAREFWKFAAVVGVSPVRPDVVEVALPSVKHHTVKPYEILSEAEGEQLLSWAWRERSPRDALMLEVMLRLGLRVSEVTGLSIEDLTRDDKERMLLRIRKGKGRKDRVLPVPSDLMVKVTRYVGTDREAENDQPWVFASRQGDGRLTNRRIQQIVDECVTGAGLVRDISPHSLRHTCAVRLLRKGASVVEVQKILGHASIRTTQRYLDHISLEELREVLR
jgi:site-specific recombinase XerD